jgi:hypothetical protein
MLVFYYCSQLNVCDCWLLGYTEMPRYCLSRSRRDDGKDLFYTVNKLRSLNLHFSSMFCIERKVVHVGAEKILRFIYIKFPSNFKIIALLLMIRKIALEVKFDEKYVLILKI